MPASIAPGKKDSVLLAALSYLFGPIVALLIYLVGKEDRWVRFHCLQALGLELAYAALFVVAGAGTIVTLGIAAPFTFLLLPATILVRVWCAYRAYHGDYFELPYIGIIAASHV